MAQSSKSYRKIFSDYQDAVKKDVWTAELTDRKKHKEKLLAEKEELERLLKETGEKLLEAEERRKQLQKELCLMEDALKRDQGQQEERWREECQKAEISESVSVWLEGGEVRTGKEIIQGVEKQLDEIERIIAGYIAAQKRNMDKIAEIIDDPGK